MPHLSRYLWQAFEREMIHPRTVLVLALHHGLECDHCTREYWASRGEETQREVWPRGEPGPSSPEVERQLKELSAVDLEQGLGKIERATKRFRSACSFLWAATMRSCPCGRGPRLQDCRCTPGQRRRFRRQVPQALRDRVDLVVEVASVGEEELRRKGSESSRVVAQRVAGARRRQRERGLSFPETDEAKVLSGWLNRDLTAGQTGRVCALDTQGTLLLEAARERFDLSVRRRFQVLKMARTIADLRGGDMVRAPHLAEALQYRMLDDVNPAYINKESAR